MAADTGASDSAVCDSGSPCGGQCVDTQTDTKNCGACGHSCSGTDDCVQGNCIPPCPIDQLRCLGKCVSVASDNANCGSCGQACGQGEVCSNGVCGTSCRAPTTLCHGPASNDAGTSEAGADATPGSSDASSDAASTEAGDAAPADAAGWDVIIDDGGAGATSPYCANLDGDNDNCGSCSHLCPTGQVCSAGTCQTQCAAPYVACGSGCVDTRSDAANCGSCGHLCAPDQVCSGGKCQTGCSGQGETMCNGACVATASDIDNCGTCGHLCTKRPNAVVTCQQGSCVVGSCATGFHDCDGNPANGCEASNLDTDVANCGACGNKCWELPNTVAGVCSKGACAPAVCASGFADCDKIAKNGCERNLESDAANCGSCGHICQPGFICSGGACGAKL